MGRYVLYMGQFKLKSFWFQTKMNLTLYFLADGSHVAKIPGLANDTGLIYSVFSIFHCDSLLRTESTIVHMGKYLHQEVKICKYEEELFHEHPAGLIISKSYLLCLCKVNLFTTHNDERL